MNQIQDDEFDLLEASLTLWQGRWKVISITFSAALFGIAFSLAQPDSYRVTTPIQSGQQSVFLPFTTTNRVLKAEGLFYDKEKNPNGYSIDRASIFENFLDEFSDYEEMMDVLSDSDYVKKVTEGMDDVKKQKALRGFAKSFKINEIAGNRILFFEWRDYADGMRLFDEAIQRVLANVQASSKDDLEKLAAAIDAQNSLLLNEFRNSLELLSREQVLARELQKQRVDEAYNLAEQAGIKPTGPPPESQLVGVIANSIHKVKMEIGSLESDFTSSQLRKSAELIGSADLGDWVDFDFSFSQVKSQKRSLLYIAITTALGGIVGSMYVLISKAIRNRREHMLKA